VVVHDFHFVSITGAPRKAEAPLIVDANAVLALAIAAQFLQPIAWNGGELIKSRRCVQGLQLAEGRTLDRPEPPYGLAIEKALRIGAPEGPNHTLLYNG
jgi:hypothetical protein